MTARAPAGDPEAVAALRLRLAAANRILYHRSVVDGFGHISVRYPLRGDRFLISTTKAPALVEASDIIEVDLDGVPTQAGTTSYLERFIHCEIYRARSDVGAIVHSHNKGAVLLSVLGQPLRPLMHTAAFLGPAGSSMFDSDEEPHAEDLLIRDSYLGHRLALKLKGASCVLMRGHGMTTVGVGIEEVVYRAIYAQANAELQSVALQIGTPKYLSEPECLAAEASARATFSRCWELWNRELLAHDGNFNIQET